MRVIAGSAKGIPLASLKGRNTRPMLDKTKEAIFSALGNKKIQNATVWDMFAGSGALGIEALSRGAEFCLFTEKAPQAMKVIKQNINKTKFDTQSQTILADTYKFLKKNIKNNIYHKKFSLIFCDPPFKIQNPEINKIFQSELATNDATIVYQSENNNPLVINKDDCFEIIWERSYSSSIIYFLSNR